MRKCLKSHGIGRSYSYSYWISASQRCRNQTCHNRVQRHHLLQSDPRNISLRKRPPTCCGEYSRTFEKRRCYRVSHTCRQANGPAHAFVVHAQIHRHTEIWMEESPPWVRRGASGCPSNVTAAQSQIPDLRGRRRFGAPCQLNFFLILFSVFSLCLNGTIDYDLVIETNPTLNYH